MSHVGRPGNRTRSRAWRWHFLAALLSAAWLLLTACAPGGSQTIGDLRIDAPWVRATPPGGAVAGGFLTIRNRGHRDDRLVSASSSAVRRIEIHEVRTEDGMMKMRQLRDGLPIAAGAVVALQPGGYHLMLIEPEQPFAGGDVVVVTLHFDDAGDADVSFRVKGLGAGAGGGHVHH